MSEATEAIDHAMCDVPEDIGLFAGRLFVRDVRGAIVPIPLSEVEVLTIRGPAVVTLLERKPRFDATFVNRFDATADGTRYSIDAEVRLKGRYRLLAPFLRGVVSRALCRYTVDPMRAAAEGATTGGISQ